MACKYHLDRETHILCQKMGVGCCQACAENFEAFTDPGTYSSFDPSAVYGNCAETPRKRAVLRERQEETDYRMTAPKAFCFR